MTIRGLLFTDLDGTLLDHDTYRASEQAFGAVARLHAAGIMTVPVSSKTASEILHLSTGVRFGTMAVAEGGGVIVKGTDLEVEGVARSELIGTLVSLRGRGWPVRGMSEMSVVEVCRRTGLDEESAARAMDRMASEPFVLEKPEGELDVDQLVRTVDQIGASITRGGRFWHLAGKGIDKGAGIAAVRRVLTVPSTTPSAAIGDAWNDLAMLAAVDVGVMLGSRVADHELPHGCLRVSATGPAGFVAAIAAINRRLGWEK